jgi:hypothetical protein
MGTVEDQEHGMQDHQIPAIARDIHNLPFVHGVRLCVFMLQGYRHVIYPLYRNSMYLGPPLGEGVEPSGFGPFSDLPDPHF